jgi:hypothetical protein
MAATYTRQEQLPPIQNLAAALQSVVKNGISTRSAKISLGEKSVKTSMKKRMTAAIFGVSLCSGLICSHAASAETITFRAELNASNEVPPNNSAATGTTEASFDTTTKALTWSITYSGLSGPAIGIHFHGPGEPGKNAGITVPFPFVGNPAKGSTVLPDAQSADLLAGKWYVNVHTALNPGGEIRGQLAR